MKILGISAYYHDSAAALRRIALVGGYSRADSFNDGVPKDVVRREVLKPDTG